MHCSPTEYINRQRLIYAAYLLGCTDDSILSISEQCGFGNLSHFYHQFKRMYGAAPLQFRKAHRETELGG